jgi:hypothetical protein
LGIGGEALAGWMESANPLFVRAAVFWGEGREGPTRSGRENAPEGGHWPIGEQRRRARERASRQSAVRCGRKRGPVAGAIGFRSIV